MLFTLHGFENVFIIQFFFAQYAGNLVNVAIPRPRPDGELCPGVGKVCSFYLFWKFSSLLPLVIFIIFCLLFVCVSASGNNGVIHAVNLT
jgi:hypothetical protein